MIRTYRALPPIVSGYPLESGKSWFSIIVPIARVNEILNPSGELGTTTGYTAGAGTLTASTEQQYHGAYSFKYVPAAAVNDGFYYTLTSTVAIRAISCKFRGAAGVPYALTYATSAGVDLVTKPFIGTGKWAWIYLYYNDASATTRRLYFRKNNSASVALYYVDGVQSEVINAGETVSTFISGDEQGLVPNQSPPAYFWNGTPHASTSTRSGLTRAGGMVIPMSKYGFLLTAIIGLGLAVPQNVATEYARIDGGFDDYTRKPTRQFSLTGRFQGRTDAELDRNRGGLSALLDRDLIGLDQRAVLRYQKLGPDGSPTSDVALIPAKYEGGLSGNTDNHFAETAAITLTQYLPLIIAEGSGGASLSVQLSVSNANAIIQRSPAGVWSALSTGMSGGGTPQVNALVRGLDGTIYASGNFTDAGGSGADFIAAWNGTAWSVLGSATAINNSVVCMAVGPDGALYVGGAFTNAGGVAAADGIAKWDGSTWTALGTGVNAGGIVYALTFDRDGNLYAGGDFTSMGGVANTNFIAKWNGAAWLAMGTGAGGGTSVTALAAIGSTVYAGGDFDNMGGVAAADDIAKWSGTAWSALGTAGTTGGGITGLAVGPDNILYIGGAFSTINGLAISFLAQWNGTSFSSMGTLNNSVSAFAFDQGGILYIGGLFDTINGIAYPDRFAQFRGNTFTPIGIDLPGSPTVSALLAIDDGTLYVGYSTTGTATAAATTTITNAGTARSYPVLTIKGPSSGTSRIYQIANATTGKSIYLNLTLSAGETATMVFTPDNLSFTSDFQGPIAGAILPGSNVADFFLQPGANTIAFLSASSTVTATIRWRPAFARLDDLTR